MTAHKWTPPPNEGWGRVRTPSSEYYAFEPGYAYHYEGDINVCYRVYGSVGEQRLVKEYDDCEPYVRAAYESWWDTLGGKWWRRPLTDEERLEAVKALTKRVDIS